LKYQLDRISGVVLAGGKARRMGGEDKGLIVFDGRPLVAHVLERLAPQVDDILISANRNQEAYTGFGWTVIADEMEGFAGPLAGIASTLRRTDADAIVTAPCDGPWLPLDLVQRLRECMVQSDAPICAAHDGTRLQQAYALIHRSALPGLDAYMQAGGRRLEEWFKRESMATADFSDRPSAFANINTPQNLEDAERHGTAPHR